MPDTNGPSPVLPKVGGGQQLTDGNSEIILGVQVTPTAKTAAATLTAAELQTGIITYTGAAANLTLPTVSDLEATVSNAKVNSSFDFIVLDLNGVGRATVVTNTGWTLVGSMVTSANLPARFRARKTGTGAWTLYRVG